MQELDVVWQESDRQALVMRVAGGESEFYLPLTADLRRFVVDGVVPARGTELPSSATVPGDAQPSGADRTTDLAASRSADSPARDATAPSAAPTSSTAAGASSEGADGAEGSDGAKLDGASSSAGDRGGDTSAPGPGAAPSAPLSPTASAPTRTADTDAASATAGESPSAGTARSGLGAAPEAAPSSPDEPTTALERHRARPAARPHRMRISITPRDIQDRVRHGASIAELAREADTDESRIEPYAWPILQERARIADLARQAHPITATGPTTETLWEVLASAFAARGESVRDSDWDAHQDAAGRWVVTVSWTKTSAGQSAQHEARFAYVDEYGDPTLAEPLESVASDLVDPRFRQPVRSVGPVVPMPHPAGQEAPYPQPGVVDPRFGAGEHGAAAPGGYGNREADPDGEDAVTGNPAWGREMGADEVDGPATPSPGAAAHGAGRGPARGWDMFAPTTTPRGSDDAASPADAKARQSGGDGNGSAPRGPEGATSPAGQVHVFGRPRPGSRAGDTDGAPLPSGRYVADRGAGTNGAGANGAGTNSAASARSGGHTAQRPAAASHPSSHGPAGADSADGGSGRPGASTADADGNFLQYPDGEDADRPRRRKKAVTPHWEDVLLGVRTNPKRKK